MTHRLITNVIILGALFGGMILAKERAIDSAETALRFIGQKASEAERFKGPQGIGTLGIRG